MRPAGTVTFLFTDIEGSTRLWEAHPEAMRRALARHDELLRVVTATNGGELVKSTGDGVLAVFSTASDAISAVVAAQQGLLAEPWQGIGELRVRMGLHAGSAETRDGDYFGATLNRAARIMGAAHGGQVVCSQSAADLLQGSLPPQCRLRDLGEHRLPDLGQPERVFQLEHPDLPSEFPSLRSLDRYPGHLPMQLTSFLGREHDVESVIAGLARARVVTLLGVGGVGKTRLALQAAADVLPSFPDGAWFCELATITDRSALPDAVTSCFGIRPQPGESLTVSLIDFIRNKQLLLLLDNCEHVIDAAGALAEAVAHRCPNVRVLATSREALAVDGELLYPVRSLGLPDEHSTPAAKVSAASVRLFKDRAQAVRSEFTVDETNATTVADICRQLDGVPLAIELAAARVGSMSVREIAQRLDHRFRLLTGGRRTALERHQTLRGAVDWSYDLLAPGEATVLKRLSVFAGGFTLNAAEEIVSDASIDRDDVVDALSGLVARSMVVADEFLGATRYRLLETIRQYARERLETSGESEPARQRHAVYYVALANDVGGGLRGPDELRWLGMVRDELANFRTAMDWYDACHDADHVFELVLALGGFEVQRLQYDIWRWLSRAAEMPQGRGDVRRAQVMAYSLMPVFVTSADLTAVAELVDDMDAAFAEAHAEPSSAAVFAHAMLALITGQIEDTIAWAKRAIDLAVATGEVHNACFQSAIFAMMLSTAGTTDDARVQAERSRSLAVSQGNLSMHVISEVALGYALATIDPERALQHLRAAEVQSASIESTMGSNVASRRIAQILSTQGDLAGALREYEQCLEMASSAGARTPLLLTVRALADSLADAGQFESAAVLSGAIEAASTRHPSLSFVQRDSQVASLRNKLGEEAERHLARGRALDMDQLITYARDEIARILRDRADNIEPVTG